MPRDEGENDPLHVVVSARVWNARTPREALKERGLAAMH